MVGGVGWMGGRVGGMVGGVSGMVCGVGGMVGGVGGMGGGMVGGVGGLVSGSSRKCDFQAIAETAKTRAMAVNGEDESNGGGWRRQR
jgi:hypothetical protein